MSCHGRFNGCRVGDRTRPGERPGHRGCRSQREHQEGSPAVAADQGGRQRSCHEVRHDEEQHVNILREPAIRTGLDQARDFSLG
jgi:hypothetical protein